MFTHFDTMYERDRQTDRQTLHDGKHQVVKINGSPKQPLGTPNFQTLKKVQNLGKATPLYQKAGYGPESQLKEVFC